jgi:hypothetical protein
VPSRRGLRLTVDFNYGGRSTLRERAVVYLNAKHGDRTGMSPDIRSQFDAAGAEPTVGMVVRLVDPAKDLDDDGVVCDLEVDGILSWADDGMGWRAFHEEDWTYVPVVP